MKLFLKIFFSLLLFLTSASSVLAADETILNFDSQMIAYKDGTFSVYETIKYDFSNNQKHGIFRDIPKVSNLGGIYRVIDISVSQILRDGESEKYQTTNSADKISIKIGDSNKTISGIHEYMIAYQVKNGIGNFDDHDEIYWNVTGNEWNVPINSASVSISSNGEIPNKAVCYTGPQGSRSQDCSSASNFYFKTSKPLNIGEGLSVVYGYPANTFPKSILSKSQPGPDFIGNAQSWLSLKMLAIIPVVGNLVIAPLLLIWYLTKKRKKSFGPPAVNFDTPEDKSGNRILPAEAGTIDSAKLEKDDIIATIFDLAIRKYLKIEQVKNKSKVLGVIDKTDEKIFIKKLKDGNDLAPFEKIIFDRLFEDLEVVEVETLKTDFYKTFQEVEKSVFKSLIEKKFYFKNPKVQKTILIVGALLSVFNFVWLLAILLFFLAKKLNGRTAEGDLMDWKIDGLKLFLKNMSRNYKWQADQLYIVEKMIPYAIALGFIDKFMEQLKIIYPDYKPDWYSGNLAFYSISNSMFNSFNTGISSNAPSSSSGFGGGGFSGGGGGGGGGGSW